MLTDRQAVVRCMLTVSQLAQCRDLNSLSRSCKTLNAIAIPRLYKTVGLKVPLQWNRLSSLESLLSSQSEGLKYTECLSIVVRQSAFEDDQYGSLEELADEHDDGVEIGPFLIYSSTRRTSKALNALIRLLVLKLPRQHLRRF